MNLYNATDGRTTLAASPSQDAPITSPPPPHVPVNISAESFHGVPNSAPAPVQPHVPSDTTPPLGFRGRTPSNASRAPSSRTHTPAAQTRHKQSFEGLERKPSVSYGHHRQTSIVNGYQHSRNHSLVSSSNTSPLSPQVILASGSGSGSGSASGRDGMPALNLSKSPSSSTLNGHPAPAPVMNPDVLNARRPERMHSGRVKRDRDHHRSRSRQHHQPEPTTVGEYALHHLLNEFITEANEMINRCVSEPDDALIRIEAICGPGADLGFDQLIKALGHIVRSRPKPLIDAVMIWRRSKSEETAPLYAEYENLKTAAYASSGTVRRVDFHHASTNSSSASLSLHPDSHLLARLEQDIKQGERRSAISVYILCRVLMEAISQCTLEALTHDIAQRLEDVIYTQLRGFDQNNISDSAIKQAQWHMFSQLLGVMSSLRFDKVVDRFTMDLEIAQRKLAIKGHTEAQLENKTALLIHSMRWLKVQSGTEDAWDRSCNLLQQLAGFFAEVHGTPVKYAYCQLFEDLLLPVAGKATSELKAPKWKHVLDTLRTKLNQLLMKPKHWTAAFPLLSVTICVSPSDVFAQQWLLTCLGLQPKLRERNTRGHALKALCRMVWVYLYRFSDGMAITQRKLDEIIRMVFQTGKRSVLSTDPPIADPLIQLIRIIGFKQQELCFRSIIFPLMNAEVILSGKDRRIESLDPERMVIAIRAFLAIMSDLEKGEAPAFPASFECDALTDPYLQTPHSHRRSPSQGSTVAVHGKAERLSKPVMIGNFGDVAKDSYVKFCKILGEITIICDQTFGGQRVVDEKFSAQAPPKTPMAEAFSFSRREELLNSPEVRQNFYDLLHVAVQALPRFLSPQIPLNHLINLLCTGTAHVQNHIAASSAQSLKSIARQSHAQLVTIGFARFIFNFDDRYATISAGSLLGHGHIENTLRLYVELLEIWIDDLQSQPQMTGSDPQDEDLSGKAVSSDLNRSRVFAHVDEIESHGLFFLCSPSRHVRAFAVRVLSLITKFDVALGQPSTRIISTLQGSSQQVIDVNDEKLSLAERSRLQKGLRRSNMNNTLVELCSSDTVHDATLWSKAFPNLVRLSFQICPQAVLLTRDIVCARLSHAHRTIGGIVDGPRLNAHATIETALTNKMVGRNAFSPPEVTIEQWKLHLIFACTTLTDSGPPPVPSGQSSQHSRKSSKASSISHEKISSAAELFAKVIPFLSASHIGVREAAAQGLGAINTNLFRTLLESLHPSVASCSDEARQWLASHQRTVSSPRRSRRSDILRTEITHLYQLISHSLHEPEIYHDEWILHNLMSYTKDLRIFLNDEEVQTQWDFQKLRTYYCGLIETLYEAIQKTKDPQRWMPFQARKAAFAMMEDWCGFSPNQNQIRQKENHMRRSLLELEHDSRNRGNVTAKMEIEKKELRTAALGAMAALCAGPISVASDGKVAMQFDVQRMLKWIDTIFESASDRNHATGRRALKNLLTHNKEQNFLLARSIEECYNAKNPKSLSSYFDVVTQVLTEGSGESMPFWKVLSAALYTLGNESAEIRMKSARLLRTLEERLGKSSKLQDLDISISDKTTAVYKLAQFGISRRLANQHSDLAFHVFSEFTKHFGGLMPDHQRNMVAAMLPWIQTIELQVLPDNGGPTASSYMLMVNLFEITARSSATLHNEIQALWQALATGPYGGNVQVVLDFIIAVCLDRREQNFVDYAKQVVVFLSTTAAGLKVVEFLLNQIKPNAMIAQKETPRPVPHDMTNLPYTADMALVLPMGNRQSGLSLGQVALMLLVDLVVSPIQLPREKISVLLQTVIVQWDHYTPLVQDQAREMLVHLIHELVISKIEPDSTDPDKQSIEDFIEAIRRHDPKVVWSYEETESKVPGSDASGVPDSMAYVVDQVVRVLGVSYNDPTGSNIREDWAKTCLEWATLCPVRHVACRSFQIFRSILNTLDHQMLADILMRLHTTIADTDHDCLPFSREILITLRAIIEALEAEDIIQYPQLFWTTSACLNSIFEQEFYESMGMLGQLLNKIDLSDPAVIKLLKENQPPEWAGEFIGLQPLIYKGLRSSVCLDRSLDMLERMVRLPSSGLIGDDSRLLYTVLANLPRYLHGFDDGSGAQIAIASAEALSNVAELQGLQSLAQPLRAYASKSYRNADDFLEQTVSAIKTAFFPALEYESLVFLIGLLHNQSPWFKVKTMHLLCVIIPEVDMRRPEIASQGPDLIAPLLRLLQTKHCQQALDVLDNIMSMAGTPLDNKHLRMSMAGSHSTRATRKEYDHTKSLYGIPEESGWSVPMPALQASRVRDCIMAVYNTCIEGRTDGPPITSTPDVGFADDPYGSYFPERIDTHNMSDATHTDSGLDELVMKLDSLDDFFDDYQVDQRMPAPTREPARYMVEDRENVYDSQTAPILRSLRRNASITSFQNGFADVRYTPPRDPLVMSPAAFATRPSVTSAPRAGLHARSITASSLAQTQRSPSSLANDMLSGDEAGDEPEPFSDDDMSISRMTTSDESISARSTKTGAAGIRANLRSGMRRLTGGSNSQVDRKEIRDVIRAVAVGQKSPKVPKVPSVWLHDPRSNPRSADL